MRAGISPTLSITRFFRGRAERLGGGASGSTQYDWPVGYKQVFNFGPVCLRLVKDALEQSKKAVHTWPAEYVERNHALLTECESCT